MENYLGEFPVELADTPQRDFSRIEWAIWALERYGQSDGAHHKAWALDQVARILHGAQISVVEARWDSDLKELRYSIGSSTDYEAWVERMLDRDADGEPQYSYDTGVA